jgi:hypothetical protein
MGFAPWRDLWLIAGTEQTMIRDVIIGMDGQCQKPYKGLRAGKLWDGE